MNRILAIVWKDILLRFSDKAELLFFIILPIVFIFLLGGASFGGAESSNTVLVVDEDHSNLSSSLLRALAAGGEVELKPVDGIGAARMFANQEAAAWLTIPAGFEAAILAGVPGEVELRKQPNSNEADAAEQAAAAAASSAGSPILAARLAVSEAERLRPFASEAERREHFEASLEIARQRYTAPQERIEVTLPPQIETGYNQGSQTLLGQLITWVFIPLVGTSGLLAYERRQKTLLRLLTSATSKSVYLLGTIFGQLVIGVAQMALLIAFGVFVMKVNLGGSPLALWLLLVTFGLASVALGISLGTFVHSEKQASNLSIMIGMVFALLSGCWWPLELFPPAMQTAVRVLPTTWAMQGLTDLSMRGLGLAGILPAVGVLLGFAVLFFTVGALRFRYE